MDKVDFATYEFTEAFAGVLTYQQRDEIDKLRLELHTKCFIFAREAMNKMETLSRDVQMGMKILIEQSQSKKSK